jgi:hypothetical protein
LVQDLLRGTRPQGQVPSGEQSLGGGVDLSYYDPTQSPATRRASQRLPAHRPARQLPRQRRRCCPVGPGSSRRVVIHNRLGNTLSSHGCEAVFAAMALESLGVQGPSFMAFTGHSQFVLSSSRENKLVSPVTRIDVGRSRGADNGAICSRSHLPVPNRAPLAGRGRSSTHEATLIEVARGSLTRPGALLIAADGVTGFAGACLMQTPYWLPSSHWQFRTGRSDDGLTRPTSRGPALHLSRSNHGCRARAHSLSPPVRKLR